MSPPVFACSMARLMMRFACFESGTMWVSPFFVRLLGIVHSAGPQTRPQGRWATLPGRA